MDLIRSQFRPQVECEMRCAQSPDLRAAYRIHSTGFDPAILFFLPLTVSFPNRAAATPPAYRQPDESKAWTDGVS
jgi:hypothetical protein